MIYVPCRQSTRLREWNYQNVAWYHVIICTNNKKRWLGHIKNGIMGLNVLGNLVANQWQELPLHYHYCHLDEWVVMPNHIHSIVIIDEAREGLKPSPTQRQHGLSEVIRGFKTFSSKYIHQSDFYDFSWQRSFYDHIIRNEKQYLAIKKYICENPLKWMGDEYYG